MLSNPFPKAFELFLVIDKSAFSIEQYGLECVQIPTRLFTISTFERACVHFLCSPSPIADQYYIIIYRFNQSISKRYLIHQFDALWFNKLFYKWLVSGEHIGALLRCIVPLSFANLFGVACANMKDKLLWIYDKYFP